jgi:tRNA pseudouridine32 synthase/23S rRNA pseudouridine746 synthase
LKAPLPIIDGVGPSCQWLPAGPWETVLDFLKERFPHVATSTWDYRMVRGQVLDETGRRLHPESRYRVGGCDFYYRELESERTIPFAESVLYQDENILVVDKPHFLPVIPAGRFLHETLLVRLRKKGAPESLVPVHRLDRETAGVVLFSLNPKTRGHYTSLFRERKVQKVYEALALTNAALSFPLTRLSRIAPGEPFFRMKEIPGEPNAETHIEVLKQAGPPARQLGPDARTGGTTLYRLIPVTGRKHQLRLHLSALGMPIVNDKLYPEISSACVSENDLDRDNDFSDPLKLLAKSISFRDPLTGHERYFESSREL